MKPKKEIVMKKLLESELIAQFLNKIKIKKKTKMKIILVKDIHQHIKIYLIIKNLINIKHLIPNIVPHLITLKRKAKN